MKILLQEFEIQSYRKRRNCQLSWLCYNIYTKYQNGQEGNTRLNLGGRYPPFRFSRVKSYTQESEAPLQWISTCIGDHVYKILVERLNVYLNLQIILSAKYTEYIIISVVAIETKGIKSHGKVENEEFFERCIIYLSNNNIICAKLQSQFRNNFLATINVFFLFLFNSRHLFVDVVFVIFYLYLFFLRRYVHLLV